MLSYPVVCGTVGENELDVRHKLANGLVLFPLEFVCYSAQPHWHLNETGVVF